MESQIKFDKKYLAAWNYRKIREFRSKSQEEVVKGLSRAMPENDSVKQNVSAWENLKGNPGPKFIDQLSSLLQIPKETFYIESLTDEYLKKNFSHENHAQMPNSSDNNGIDAALGLAYKIIMEGGTEYMLIARNLLQDKHRIIAVETIESNERMVNRLLDQNMSLISRVMELESKLPDVKKSQQKS